MISERMFGKNWQRGLLVLQEDSTLTAYADQKPEVGLKLSDAPEMIACGQVRERIARLTFLRRC